MSRDTKQFLYISLAIFAYLATLFFVIAPPSLMPKLLVMGIAGALLLGTIFHVSYLCFIQWLKTPVFFFAFAWLAVFLTSIEFDVGSSHKFEPYTSFAGIDFTSKNDLEKLRPFSNLFFFLAFYASWNLYKQKIQPLITNRK